MTKLNFNLISNCPCNVCGGCNSRHRQGCEQWQQYPPQYQQYPHQGGPSMSHPAGVFLPPRPLPAKDDGEGISMGFRRFTASREEHHLALDIKDYINYLETGFPGSYALDDFVWRSKEVLRNEMIHFNFDPSRAHLNSFKNFSEACKLANDPQRAPMEQYRETLLKYEHYLRTNSQMDFAAFKAAREKQAKDDRLTLNSEENPTCCCDECEEDFNFDCDSFFDTCINDVDVDVLFNTPVNEIHDPNLYDEDSDGIGDSDDSDDTILNLNEQWEANKPRVPFSDYTKSIWHSPVPVDAYELLLADLDHYKTHYLTPRGTYEEKTFFERMSVVLHINGVREGYGWVPPKQQLQSLGALMESKIQKQNPNLAAADLTGEFLEKANDALREYPPYLFMNSDPETLASFRAARAEWALLDRREFNGLPRIAN